MLCFADLKQRRWEPVSGCDKLTKILGNSLVLDSWKIDVSISSYSCFDIILNIQLISAVWYVNHPKLEQDFDGYILHTFIWNNGFPKVPLIKINLQLDKWYIRVGFNTSWQFFPIN